MKYLNKKKIKILFINSINWNTKLEKKKKNEVFL